MQHPISLTWQHRTPVLDAEWRSLGARVAHTHQVAGSNPASAKNTRGHNGKP